MSSSELNAKADQPELAANKKVKVQLTPEEKKAKYQKLGIQWMKVLIVMSSIIVYIGFTMTWTEKWGAHSYYGSYTTLLFGVLCFSYGVLSHVYILHKFGAITWMISMITCITGIVLMAGLITFIVGGIFIALLIIEAIVNRVVFKDLKYKFKKQNQSEETLN